MTQSQPSMFRTIGCALACSAVLVSSSSARADEWTLPTADGTPFNAGYCPDVWLDADCPRRAPLPLDRPTPGQSPASEQANERRVTAYIQRGPILGERELLWENGRAPMEAGVETDPTMKWQVRHEFMSILAELADEPALRGWVSRYRLKPDVNRLRAMRAADELNAQRRRGTLNEIEDEMGSDRMSGIHTGAFVTGAVLFGVGAGIAVVMESPEANTPHATIRPKFGTPGIKLKGQFDSF